MKTVKRSVLLPEVTVLGTYERIKNSLVSSNIAYQNAGSFRILPKTQNIVHFIEADYMYDANGNLIFDDNKGISSTTYK